MYIKVIQRNVLRLIQHMVCSRSVFNIRCVTPTCCLFSISSFIRMLRHLRVSWKVCLSVFSIRTLWKAPTTLPHRNTTALDSSYRKQRHHVRATKRESI